MSEPISVLIIDDSVDDADLLARALRIGGFEVDHKRVDDAAGLSDALEATNWDIILSDYAMPHFDSFAALELVKAKSKAIPFIVVSGTVGEEVAVQVMKSGANDYFLKDNLIRLVPAIRRVLKEAETLRQVEDDLSASEDHLRHAQKLKAIGQLTGGIAHDFNNLLAIIIGNLELIEIRAENLSAKDRKSINMALAAATRGAELTQRLLSFSRLRRLVNKHTQVNELLPGFSALAQRTIGEDIEIEMILESDLWPVMVDRAELELVLLNLAINARDAMIDGGRLTIETANRTLAESDYAIYEDLVPGDYVMIAITDTGTGMLPEVREHAFEPFYTTKGMGSGMGLSMVFGFARQSGGQVVIESEPGEGTVIKIYLPKSDSLSPPITSKASAEPTLPGHETILIVEDDVDVRNFLIAALANLGYAILSAEDGPAALHVMATAGEINMLLTDVVLPHGMNGREVAQAFVKQYPAGGVLFSSGYPGEILEFRGHLDEGMTLINKPYKISDLARQIRKILDAEKAARDSNGPDH